MVHLIVSFSNDIFSYLILAMTNTFYWLSIRTVYKRSNNIFIVYFSPLFLDKFIICIKITRNSLSFRSFFIFIVRVGI